MFIRYGTFNEAGIEVSIVKARSDINDFPTIGEAIDEALTRADGAGVSIHKQDDSREHALDDECWCNPAVIG